MSRKVILWPFWTGAILLGIVWVLFYYRDNRNYECEGCHFRLVKNQARLGIWTKFAIPINSISAQEQPSNLFLDYLVSEHTHEWRFVQGSPYGVFGWGGCATGGRKRTGNLAYLYEKELAFRNFIHKKQANGSLNTKDFVTACLLEEPSQYISAPYPDGYITREAAIERESPEVQRLRRFATALEKEYSPQ